MRFVDLVGEIVWPLVRGAVFRFVDLYIRIVLSFLLLCSTRIRILLVFWLLLRLEYLYAYFRLYLLLLATVLLFFIRSWTSFSFEEF